MGNTDWGMLLPATHAANSLMLITVKLFTVYTDKNSIVVVKILLTWIWRVEKYYKKVEDKCFPNINAGNYEES